MKNLKKPDFENFLKVLKREPNAKPALFELFMGFDVYEKLAGRTIGSNATELDWQRIAIEGFTNGGYDYVSMHGCGMYFPQGERKSDKSYSANDGAIIVDRKTFDEYKWPEPQSYDYSILKKVEPYLPENMKIMVMGPGGVLENVMGLTGYDNLCYMLYEDPELAEDIFNAVGSRLCEYYKISAQYDTVGFLASNDDWGFNTQTFLSVEHMRKYVFPWHKKIVEAAHEAGKPIVLHSCGYAGEVMDDIIDDIKYDGRHSYEDAIMPVEKFYDSYSDRITVLGGIDVDYLVRRDEDEIKARAINLLEKSKTKGAYALGSGNSIPHYVPYEKYLAMIDTVRFS